MQSTRYLPRFIDPYLLEWAGKASRKPLLLRGPRQVGKSWAVRNLGKNFKNFIEINFEKSPEFKSFFSKNLDAKRIVSEISILTNIKVEMGETLLFLDEIQDCREAIMALRYFKEDLPELHVVAAGSLLEFALADIPTFGVGRIHSMFMYPMTFDEFLTANGETMLIEIRNEASPLNPLSEPVHNKLVEFFRLYMLVGGMPEVVSKWVDTKDYVECQEIQDDLLISYEADFAKYRKKADPALLRNVFRSAAVQLTEKFTYADVPGGYKTYEVKRALQLLMQAGILIPVMRTDANGVPLGSESDSTYFKILTLDTGLSLRLLSLHIGEDTKLKQEILTASASDLVNKGPIAELVAGLELLRYGSPNIRHEIFYWTRLEKNATAEIDYVISPQGEVLPVEVKAGTQGGMKSLWIFMRAKGLQQAVRTSLENFGSFQYTDPEDHDATRSVVICPLYALSRLPSLLPIH